MRILFSSTRGTGHTQPLLPYARALQARGHAVRVAAPASVAELLGQAGLVHAPFDHPGDAALAPIWARLRGLSPEQSNALAAGEIFAGLNAESALPKLQETIRGFRPDLIVRDSVEFGSLIAAESAGVPHARVAVHLVSFEEAIPAAVAESLARLRKAAGLSPDHGESLTSEPCFSAFPEALERAPAAGSRAPAPFRARMPDEEPDPARPAFQPAGDPRPLVYVTFGTIAGTTPRVRAVYRVALDALAELSVQALLTTGRGFDVAELGAIPENVHVAEWVPQREVLVHARAVVCHGGSGTVRGTLAAGVPLVVVPLFADQHFNAERIAEARAGLAVPDADSALLGAAILRVLADAELRAGAKVLAAAIAALPPIDAAVDALLSLASAAPRSDAEGWDGPRRGA